MAKKAKKKSAGKTARKAATRSSTDLLIELGTEELPPKALKSLSENLGRFVHEGLAEAGLLESDDYRVFAAPRRLAVLFGKVRLQQPDRETERKGPAAQAAFDADGKPTKALEGFARSCGVTPDKLEKVQTDKGEWMVFRSLEKGQKAAVLVPAIFENALKKLPIPKRMRWGDLDAEFVRPVHWLLMLHGDKLVPAEMLAVKSGRVSYGHRFHAPKAIRIPAAKDYERLLKSQGKVIANFAVRQQLIRSGVEKLAVKQKGQAVINVDLLDEVTSLVEWPEPVLGSFDHAFLDVPAEALISSMQDHQKYFPVIGRSGKLMPHFITVANIKSRKPAAVRAGNERVLRARFSDAKFFWDTDRKTALADRIAALKDVVFHVKLGTVHDKVERVKKLSAVIATELGGDKAMATRAAQLARADLMTGMVFEFPDLQGIMGRYYAVHDGEPADVAAAMEEQYMPRFAGDQLPKTATGQALAVAEKIDSIVGIFSIGEVPTGDKDPFALRRAALGALRIMIEADLDLDLLALVRSAAASQPGQFDMDKASHEVYGFMMERLRAYYADQGVAHDEFESVLATKPSRPLDFDRRIKAVKAFRKLKEAEPLTAANKRIRNILKQGGTANRDHVSKQLLSEPAEVALADKVIAMSAELEPVFAKGDYTAAMKKLAALRPQVDDFFDKVMVMVDEEAVRDNRLALLDSLGRLFLRIADLSKLQG
ncbi:MAG: glycine--tRNA ligase subunit beta [Gammaproteobacteria bacterium]|nr:glycine--tRNA ligase subunit beta [Gammaproteobacteria bacterium]